MRKTLFLFGVFLLLLGCFLWIGGITPSRNQPRILLIGVDGGSWDMVQRLVAENRLPNIQKLVENGAAGYLNSLAWRKKSGGGAGFYSPIVWATIATGKLPSKHGVEDFKVPIPNTVRVRMGVREDEESTVASLAYPLTSREDKVIVMRAKAPPKARSSNIQVLFNSRPTGGCEFGDQFSNCRAAIPTDLVRYGENRIDFRFSRVKKIGPNSVALDVDYIRIHDVEGRELLDYNYTRNANYFTQGWFHEVPTEYALASSRPPVHIGDSTAQVSPFQFAFGITFFSSKSTKRFSIVNGGFNTQQSIFVIRLDRIFPNPVFDSDAFASVLEVRDNFDVGSLAEPFSKKADYISTGETTDPVQG